MKWKLSGLVNRGIGAFGVLMNCKLVSIIIFLFTGTLHIIDPRGGLRGTVTMLSLFIALYALLSIVFILTGSNDKVGEGKKFASDMVRDTFKGDGNPMMKINEVLSQNEKFEKGMSGLNTKSKWDQRIQKLNERHNKQTQASKFVMIVFYIILLASTVVLFAFPDDAISLVHIIFGAMLIFDGASGVWGIIVAKRSGIPMKGQWASFFLNLLSVVIGVVFIILSNDSADFTMMLCGIVLVVKALSDLFIMIRNHELISTVKNTVSEIKHQKPEETEMPEETEKTEEVKKTEETEKTEEVKKTEE